MVARWATATLAGMAAMLAGCGHLPFGHHPVPRGGETITYQVTRCFGRCPAYSVTLGPDGQGIFTGEANTDVVGERRFRVTPEQARAFADALARLRPDGERLVERGRPDCGLYATDSSSIEVTWQAADGTARLRLDLGCRGKRAVGLRQALQGLPLTYLPLEEFLGSD